MGTGRGMTKLVTGHPSAETNLGERLALVGDGAGEADAVGGGHMAEEGELGDAAVLDLHVAQAVEAGLPRET